MIDSSENVTVGSYVIENGNNKWVEWITMLNPSELHNTPMTNKRF